MSFSNEWESIYQAGMQHASWPWSDLVSLVFRHVSGGLAGRRVLELGCGTGANAPFFLALGAAYSAIEGSETAVAVVHKRFPTLADSVATGDFTRALPSSGPFDLVVDRASLTHNSTQAIRRTLELVRNNLRPGGYYIGVDWFSERHSDRSFGKPVDDERTLTDFSGGQFLGCGKVHFCDEAHLRDLFAGFEVLFLVEKTSRHLQPNRDHLMATFDIVARKPHD